MLAYLVGLLVVAAPLAAQRSPGPVPQIDSGGRALVFSFPGMRIGVAEYAEGPTGTTVFHFPKGVKAAVDVRGGSPGTLNTDAVRLSYESKMMRAVVFSGGSWYGLSAATGAANELKDIQAEQGDRDTIAGVLSAIIYDVGGRRFTRVTPDDRLGRAAVRSAREGWFPQGARGAGRFAMQGFFYLSHFEPDLTSAWPHSGQGGAFRQVGPTKVAVFTVVNALGTVVDRAGNVVRCHRNSEGSPCPSAVARLKDHLARIGLRTPSGPGQPAPAPTGNTTVTLVVTNQRLPYWALNRLAVQVHSSMARAIQPFATEEDGDVLFAVTTDEVENPALTPELLSTTASEVAWDAVLNSVPDLPRAILKTPVSLGPDARTELPGSYHFPGGGVLVVGADRDGLSAQFTGNGQMYFETGRRYQLIPTGPDRFVVDGPSEEQVRFERQAGRVAAIVLNPGSWPQRGARPE